MADPNAACGPARRIGAISAVLRGGSVRERRKGGPNRGARADSVCGCKIGFRRKPLFRPSFSEFCLKFHYLKPCISALLRRNNIAFPHAAISLFSGQQIHRPPAGTKSKDERGTAMLATIVRFFREWRRYNQSLSELNRLGDRELADIGISRSDIHARGLERRPPGLSPVPHGLSETARGLPRAVRFWAVAGEAWPRLVSANDGQSSCDRRRAGRLRGRLATGASWRAGDAARDAARNAKPPPTRPTATPNWSAPIPSGPTTPSTTRSACCTPRCGGSAR